ncbi:MAG: hypothetical protein ABIL68_12360 [bacterium]
MLSDKNARYRGEKTGRITTPWNYQFDIRLDRTFKIGHLSFTAYFYIQNIFNRKNVLNVYWRTGEANTDGFWEIIPGYRKSFLDGMPEFVTLYDFINIRHRQHYQIEHGGDLFGRPREIRFGVRIGFGADE